MTWKVGHGLAAMVYQISIDAVNVRPLLTADSADKMKIGSGVAETRSVIESGSPPQLLK